MRRPNHGCASAVKTKTSPKPPETLAPQFDYWAPKSRISAAFTLTKAPKSGSWVDEAKYGKMLLFGRKLPVIRQQVEKDLARPGMPRRKVLATIVRLLEKTLARV